MRTAVFSSALNSESDEHTVCPELANTHKILLTAILEGIWRASCTRQRQGPEPWHSSWQKRKSPADTKVYTVPRVNRDTLNTASVSS